MQHVVVHRPPQLFPDDYIPEADSIFPFEMDLPWKNNAHGCSAVGTCNDTHTTCYHDADAAHTLKLKGNVVHIFIWHPSHHDDRYPAAPERPQPNDILLFYTTEPPNMIPFDAVQGFDGEVG